MSNIARLMGLATPPPPLLLTAGTFFSIVGYYETNAGTIDPDPFYYKNGELRRLYWDGTDHHLLFWNSPDEEPSKIFIDGASRSLSGSTTSYTFGGSQAFFDGVQYQITFA